jgi:hypothetical protein
MSNPAGIVNPYGDGFQSGADKESIMWQLKFIIYTLSPYLDPGMVNGPGKSGLKSLWKKVKAAHNFIAALQESGIINDEEVSNLVGEAESVVRRVAANIGVYARAHGPGFDDVDSELLELLEPTPFNPDIPEK